MNAAEKYPSVVFNNLGKEPIHRAIRRLRWFKSSFISQVNSVSQQTGIQYETNTEVLARCFLAWLKEFEANKPEDPAEYEAFVGHASGMMLRRLIELKPLRHLAIPEPLDNTDPAKFWPEGYVYVMYCLNIRKLVVDEAFSTGMEISDAISDISTWWSFRENVGEMSSYAIAFLDMFAGQQPDFDTPYVFQPKAAGSLLGAAPKLSAKTPVTGHARDSEDAPSGLAFGLQIGLRNSRAVLLDLDGAILFEQDAQIEYVDGAQISSTHALLLDALLAAANANGITDAATQSQGVFVSVPAAMLPDAAAIRTALEQKTGFAVTVAGSATTAAIAEISLGVGVTESSFLMIWLEAPLETRLVLDGKITNAASVVRKSDSKSAVTSASVSARTTDATAHQEKDLLTTVEVLHRMLGLRQLVCAPIGAAERFQPLLDEIVQTVPDVDIRFSEVSKSPEAFGAACLQFADIVISGELEA